MPHIDPIELSQELIRCPSVTPMDAGTLDVLQNALTSLGFVCQRMPFEEKNNRRVDNLYARLGHAAPNICFAGHTDVVPPGNTGDWDNPPFDPVIIDEILYGRGVVDMKCAIACFVSAVSDFVADKGQPKGSISFLITGDEEGIAINGTRKMLAALKEKGEKIDACIVGEPTCDKKFGDTIKIGRRGSVSFHLSVIGKQGHVAYPHLADNPVSRMTKILHALDSHNLDDGTEFFQPSNLEIVDLEVGNTADNVIPARAHATFNIRFNDTHTSHTLIRWIEGICDSICEEGGEYRLEPRVSGEAFLTKPGPLSTLLTTAVEEITHTKPELGTAGGTSDARFIKDYCPVVEFGLRNQTAHKVNEHAPVEEIRQLAQVYRRALELYFG